MNEIIAIINKNIKEREDEIHAKVKELRLKWKGIPKVSIHIGRKIKIEFPKYVKTIAIGKSHCKLFGFVNGLEEFNQNMDIVYKQEAVQIPCPFVREYNERPLHEYHYKRIEPILYIISDDEFQIYSTGKNMFIYCTLLDYRIVGNTATPLLVNTFSSLYSISIFNFTAVHVRISIQQTPPSTHHLVHHSFFL